MPYSYQQEILDKLEAERTVRGYTRNLVVAATGTGKADKDYSPTTMYNDYSINERLFHWQSQSTTAAESPTGQRYIHHRERGSKVLLHFQPVRDHAIERNFEVDIL